MLQARCKLLSVAQIILQAVILSPPPPFIDTVALAFLASINAE